MSESLATIPFDEIIPGASARVCVIDDVQYLSIRDVIMYYGNKKAQAATKTWDRLPDYRKQEVCTECTNFHFPGQGQSEQPVITFRGALKLVMWIGGENAKDQRSAMVKTLTRYYAGDGSLTDEIEANAQSVSPIAQMARASLAAEQVEDRSLIDLKRKREDLEHSKLELDIESKRIANRAAGADAEAKMIANRAAEAEIKRKDRAAEADVESKKIANRAADLANNAADIANSEQKHVSLVKVSTSYRDLCQDTVMDERARLIFKDNFLNMAMVQSPGAAKTNGDQASTNNNKPVSLSLIATELGMKLSTGELISIGVELKKRYFAKHGKEPSKHDQLCNGRMTKVNSYTESDRALIEEVLRWHGAK